MTLTHTNEENHYTVFIVILQRGTLGVLVTFFVIPPATGKDVYCFYTRLVVLFVAKKTQPFRHRPTIADAKLA